MFTSYFAKYNGNYGVSIAVETPVWVITRNPKIKCYASLAPTWELVHDLKLGLITEQEYEEKYFSLLEDRRVTPKKVLRDLGEKAVLLCYEKPGIFCHRHLVAKWMGLSGIEVKDI